jgi:two-component system sensor histidine kinase KdpD
VPDLVMDRADEIVLVDLPTDAMIERLAAAGRPLERGAVLALRELALRRTAERIDVDVQRDRRERGVAAPLPSRERLLVCVGASPTSERLIRAGRRMAERLDASWVVATVDVVGAAPLGERDRDRLDAHLRLAEALGAEVERLHGGDIAGVLLSFARDQAVTRLVVGKPRRTRLRDRLRRSPLDRLVRSSGAIDVHVIAAVGDVAPAQPRRHERAELWAYSSATASIVVATGLGLVVRATPVDAAMIFLVAVMLAALAGRGPALLAASLAVAAYDFCFVPPRWSFRVDDARALATFAVMFGAGLVISELMGRLRRQESDAVVRERRTAGLLAFTRDVASAEAIEDIAAVLVAHVEALLDVGAAVLVPEDDAGLGAVAGLMPLAAAEEEVARWSFAHAQPAGFGTTTMARAHVAATPLVVGDAPVGVLVVQPRRGGRPLDAEQRHLVDALGRQAGLAIGRARAAGDAHEARLRARTEELRSSLLSAVSHDLRTPLAVITGAATSLRDDAAAVSPPVRAELLDTIVTEAQRLERVLANLLAITRVETGLQPAREWVPVEEVVGGALGRLEGLLGDRAVAIDVPGDLAISVDPILFEQVLLNLIENAAKHGRPPIEISARRRDGDVEIEVGDHGDGLPPGSETRVFDKFFRAPGARPGGVGLGLAVCRGIVEAHGGTITAAGARFTIRLPEAKPS